MIQLCVAAILSLMLVPAATAQSRLHELAGAEGIVYAVDSQDRALVAHNSNRAFLPASTLKIFTALLAAEQLGLDSRYRTEFYLEEQELIVRGFGDPFLVSEELARIAAALATRLKGQTLTGIAIDDSYFGGDVRIPGVGRSTNPYDALNAAVAVNFNTIAVRRRGNRIESAEPQTPLTPLAEALARAHRARGVTRLQLGDNPAEVVRYAGELIAAKLRAAGITIGAGIRRATAPQTIPIYSHEPSRTVADICRDMLAVSNNFVANQLFLTIGAAAFGPPATLEKSRRAAQQLLTRHPELAGLRIVEGSGIAYQNSVTPAAMIALLRLFEPYRLLLKEERGSRHKTGTLKAVATLAGYLETEKHGRVRYVIALPGGTPEQRWRVLAHLQSNLK